MIRKLLSGTIFTKISTKNMMTQCSVFEIIFNVPNFYGFSIDILRMRGCVVLALEEWVVLYIIDTRRSLDLGLLFSIYHPWFISVFFLEFTVAASFMVLVVCKSVGIATMVNCSQYFLLQLFFIVCNSLLYELKSRWVGSDEFKANSRGKNLQPPPWRRVKKIKWG